MQKTGMQHDVEHAVKYHDMSSWSTGGWEERPPLICDHEMAGKDDRRHES